MEGSTFSIRNAIAYGWTKAFEHLWLFIKIALTFLAVEFVFLLGYLPIFLLYLAHSSTLMVISYGLFIAYSIAVGLFLFCMAYLGLPRILLDIYEHNHSSVSRMFSAFYLILPYIGAMLLVILIAVLPRLLMGLLFYFEVPMIVSVPFILIAYGIEIYLTIRFLFYSFALIDTQKTAIASLKESWRITHGVVLKLILFYIAVSLLFMGVIALAVLNVFGLISALNAHWYSLAFLSGLLLTCSAFFAALVFPIFMLAQTYVYKQLSARNEQQL